MSGVGRLNEAATSGRRSIRIRLLLLALLPLAVVLPVLLAVLAIGGGDYLDRLLITKVRSDLAVAHGYFERSTNGSGVRWKGWPARSVWHGFWPNPAPTAVALREPYSLAPEKCQC